MFIKIKIVKLFKEPLFIVYREKETNCNGTSLVTVRMSR